METDRTVLGTCPHISYSHILIYPYPYPYKYLYQYHSTLAASCCHCHSSAPQHCTRDTSGISHFFILAILFMPGHHFVIVAFNLGSNSFISPSRAASEHLMHLIRIPNTARQPRCGVSVYPDRAQFLCRPGEEEQRLLRHNCVLCGLCGGVIGLY